MNKLIKVVVSNLIKKYETNDIYELIDKMDIIFLRVPLDPSINGFYQYFKRNKIIYINSILSPDIERHVLAHELGHAVLHPKSNSIYLECNTFYSKDQFEIEANSFASEILIPDNIFTLHPNKTITDISLIENLPIQLLELKLTSTL